MPLGPPFALVAQRDCTFAGDVVRIGAVFSDITPAFVAIRHRVYYWIPIYICVCVEIQSVVKPKASLLSGLHFKYNIAQLDLVLVMEPWIVLQFFIDPNRLV